MCNWRLGDTPGHDWTLVLAYLSTWRKLWLLNIEQEPGDRQNVCDAEPKLELLQNSCKAFSKALSQELGPACFQALMLYQVTTKHSVWDGGIPSRTKSSLCTQLSLQLHAYDKAAKHLTLP